MAHEPPGRKPMQLRSYPAHREAHYHTNIRTLRGETFRRRRRLLIDGEQHTGFESNRLRPSLRHRLTR